MIDPEEEDDDDEESSTNAPAGGKQQGTPSECKTQQNYVEIKMREIVRAYNKKQHTTNKTRPITAQIYPAPVAPT